MTNLAQQLIVFIVLFFGGFGFAYVKYFWIPISTRIQHAHSDLINMEARIQGAVLAQQELKKIGGFPNQQEETRHTEPFPPLPTMAELPYIKKKIHLFARGNKVEITGFEPLEQIKTPHYVEARYAVKATMKFRDLETFLETITRADFLAHIHDLSLKPSKLYWERDLTFKLYVYLDRNS